MIEIIQFIIIVAIIVTFMGWCLDWIFSGTINPIYVEDETGHEFASITCPTCSNELRYSLQLMKKRGEVKCNRCGSFISEKSNQDL